MEREQEKALRNLEIDGQASADEPEEAKDGGGRVVKSEERMVTSGRGWTRQYASKGQKSFGSVFGGEKATIINCSGTTGMPWTVLEKPG